MFNWSRVARVVTAVVWMGSPVVALAGGMNLAWNACLGEGGGVHNANFACDTNTGSHLLVGSFIPDENLDHVFNLECRVEIATASTSLPMWWTFRQPGACRANSLGVNNVLDPSDVVCEDWAQETSSLVSSCYVGERGPNTTSIKIGAGLNNIDEIPIGRIESGHEYFYFNMLINHAKSVASDCSGCTVPACIVVDAVMLQCCDPVWIPDGYCGGPLTSWITGGAGPGTNFVTWQGGGSPTVGGRTGCPAATPARRATWAEVRALYR